MAEVADRPETWSRLAFDHLPRTTFGRRPIHAGTPDLSGGRHVPASARAGPIIATPGTELTRPPADMPDPANPVELMAAKILVVDDDANVQRLLQYTLKQEGYDVVVASDGAEGFRLWGAEAPDLILLDVMLPKLDGYQVAAKIRSEEGSASHVPIIMLTAEREVEQKVRGLRAGADDYLIKPFHPAELLARIKSLLARFAPRETLLARPPLGRILAFYGAKGGVGTTTIAINSAIAHRELGRKVALVDANLQFGDAPVFSTSGPIARASSTSCRPPSIDSISSGRSRCSDLGSTCSSPRRPRRRAGPPGAPADHHEQLASLYDYTLIDVDKRLDDVNPVVFEACRDGVRGHDGGPVVPQERQVILETMDHLGYPASKVSWCSTGPTPSPASTSRTPRARSSGRSSTRSSTSIAARSAR